MPQFVAIEIGSNDHPLDLFCVFPVFPQTFQTNPIGVSNILWFDLTCLENRSISYFYSVNWGIPIAIDLWSGILILQPETLL